MANDTPAEMILSWISGIVSQDAGTMEGTDLMLNQKSAKRFALGIHENNPMVCWLEEDGKALSNIRWTSAAIAYGLKGSDWVVINCPDIRIKNSQAMNPVKFRIFIPVSTGRLDAWKEADPKFLTIGTTKLKEGQPFLSGRPSIKIPIKLIG